MEEVHNLDNELSKALKQKIDAQLRMREMDKAPSIFEGASGSVIVLDPSQYQIPLVAGENVHIGSSGGAKVVNAIVPIKLIIAGDGIEILEDVDDDSILTISAVDTDALSISGIPIDIVETLGKNTFVLTYDEINNKFILSETLDTYSLPQATETTLGGIMAKERVFENSEIAIDSTTGKLYGIAPDAAENGVPPGGNPGQFLSKVDLTDYNVEWSDSAYSLPIASETVLGGVKAVEKTTETEEIAVDPLTGQLYYELPETYSLPIASETVLGGVKAVEKTTETEEIAVDPLTGQLYYNAPVYETILNQRTGTPLKVWIGTETQYSEITTPDIDTIYIRSGSGIISIGDNVI